MNQLPQCSRNVALALGLFVAGTPARAEIADLVVHNGFEACWSGAVTQDVFTAGASAPMEGAQGCIPASDPMATVSWCNASTCNGAPGCPITFRSGMASYLSGNSTGSARYDVSGGFDPFSADTAISGSHCTLTVTNTSSGKVDYSLYLNLIADGNNGIYTESVGAINNTAVSGISSSDYSLSGDFTCSVITFQATWVASMVQSAASDSLPEIMSADLGESICPYSP